MRESLHLCEKHLQMIAGDWSHSTKTLCFIYDIRKIYDRISLGHFMSIISIWNSI